VARYRMRKGRSGVSIELTDVAGQERELLEAFGECREGRCSCPTDEYLKVASMDVQSHDDRIDIRLEPKPGEDLDTSEIAACLDHTVDSSRR